MPLHQHMADAAGVTEWLWDHLCAPHLQERVAVDVGGDIALTRRMVTWLAAAHDLGKASPVFNHAHGTRTLMEKICSTGLPISDSITPSERRGLPHSVVSELILSAWLTERFDHNLPTAHSFAAIPGGHHGRYASAADLKPPADRLWGDSAWRTVQFELADYCADLAGLSADDFELLAHLPLTQPSAIAITGLVIMGDWIASNVDFFTFRRIGSQADRVRQAMEDLALPGIWSPTPPTATADHFRTRFEIDNPRPMQSALTDLAWSIDQPEFIVVESPTGEGKTAAALVAAEILAHRFGLGGMVFALPTRATSDAIFTTTKKWLSTTLDSGDTSVALVHGAAEFNDEFAEIPRSSHVYESGDDTCAGEAIAHWWLSGRGKMATMSSIVLCTIDQVLLAALQAKHVVLRQLGLAGKVVIIDEVHAADEFMAEYLKSVLTWLGAFGVPVIALTATLPPAHRRSLVDAYNKGRKRRSTELTTLAYPLLTHTSHDGARHFEFPASSRASSVTVDELSGGPTEVVASVLTAIVDGGHAAVVCNTVTRAQAVYRELWVAAGSDVEVVLLHSRFVLPHRLRLETTLRDRLGPSVTRSSTTRLVVVATQVIEQSLDLDFDIMFTDIAPVDLIIQRAGRLHRHSRPAEERAPALREPRLILTGFERSADSAPRLDRGCALVYGAAALLRAIAVLDRHRDAVGPLRSPADVAPLVTSAYDEALSPPPGWESAWSAAEASRRGDENERRRCASEFALPRPKKGPLTGFAQVGANGGEQGAARVRDSEDSIEVVVIQRSPTGRLLPSPWSEIDSETDVNLGPAVDNQFARKLAREVVRLPSYLGRGPQGDAIIEELEGGGIDCWQQSRWLRGMLPLILDPNGNAVIAGHSINYDIELGLVVDYAEAQ
ncbi:putative CRISPR-associated helicase [Gordonia effusa NBRC 100432]|uniref:Putative CRISPR-associated helicase n=2 Tax=Gordonia effusa TaxID=263908 RepID=H0R5C9_9ACTN|nr:putative CRISPR-associated helicase [Gordonia effusa NBRC 100432]